MYFLGSEISVSYFAASIVFWGLFGSVLNWFFGPTKKNLIASVHEGFKRAIILAGIVFVLGMVMNYFKPQQQEGTFTASVKMPKASNEPLNFDVDFANSRHDAVLTKVQTDVAEFIFSSHGATLIDAAFTRNLSGNRKQLFTIWKEGYFTEKQYYPFMLALDTNTPYDYDLIDREDFNNRVVLTYKGHSDQGVIFKKFTIYKDNFSIELSLRLQPKKSMRPRLIWASPALKELGEYDSINSIACTKLGKVTITPAAKIVEDQGYMHPEIYGSDNKYFLCALIKDTNKFSERAYSRKIEESAYHANRVDAVNYTVVSYLEGKEIFEDTTWDMTFYFGPKELEPLIHEDARLEKILDYGWFSFVTKPMLSFLKYCDYYTHNYGYAILLATLLLKLLLLPFTFRGDKKMREFQESQRQLEYLEKKYKDNPELLNQVKAEHALKNGMTMLGGCLPQFIQMPFLLGLQGALRNSLELYEQPFLWIKDLSVPDHYYILPFLMFISFVFSFFLNQKNTKGVRGVLWPLVIGLVMGGVGTIMASGLGLYLLFNNILHIIQIRVQRAFGL